MPKNPIDFPNITQTKKPRKTRASQGRILRPEEIESKVKNVGETRYTGPDISRKAVSERLEKQALNKVSPENMKPNPRGSLSEVKVQSESLKARPRSALSEVKISPENMRTRAKIKTFSKGSLYERAISKPLGRAIASHEAHIANLESKIGLKAAGDLSEMGRIARIATRAGRTVSNVAKMGLSPVKSARLFTTGYGGRALGNLLSRKIAGPVGAALSAYGLYEGLKGHVHEARKAYQEKKKADDLYNRVMTKIENKAYKPKAKPPWAQ